MNRKPYALLFLLLAFAATGLAGGSAARSNEFVECTMSVRPDSLKAGSTGMLLIRLKPKPGIHVNLTPPLKVMLDSTKVITASASRHVPKKKEYLDTTKPIKHAFTLSSKIPPGTSAITGTLTYYYCSDAEGWCSKFTLPIDQKITVVK